MDTAGIEFLDIWRALRAGKRQRQRIVAADVPHRRTRDREWIVLGAPAQRRVDGLPFLPRSKLDADRPGLQRLHQVKRGVAGLAQGQERLAAGGTEPALRMLDAEHPPQAADRLVREVKANVVGFVLEGGGLLLPFDLVVFVVRERQTKTELFQAWQRVAVFAADVEAFAPQLDDRNLAVLVAMVVLVTFFLAMRAAVQAAAMRMAALVFVVVTRQAVLASLAGVGKAQIAAVADP